MTGKGSMIKVNCSRLGVVLISLIAVCVFASCSNDESKFEVLDSGVEAYWYPDTYWMDDDRVMFFSNKAVRIWDTRTNSVSKYADAEWTVCYDRRTQYIYYGVQREDESGLVRVKHGKMGEEKLEIIPNTTENLKRLSALNKFTCVPRDRPNDEPEPYYEFLYPGDGYIASRRMADGNRRSEYVTADGRTFRIPGYFFTLRGYLEWKKGYFFWGSGSTRGGWIYKDGTIEEIQVDMPIKNMTGSMFSIPVRFGYLFVSHDIDGGDGPGKAGIYLFRDNEYERIIKGISDAISISPNGCRAAFVNEPSTSASRMGQRTIRMIEFCQKN